MRILVMTTAHMEMHLLTCVIRSRRSFEYFDLSEATFFTSSFASATICWRYSSCAWRICTRAALSLFEYVLFNRKHTKGKRVDKEGENAKGVSQAAKQRRGAKKAKKKKQKKKKEVGLLNLHSLLGFEILFLALVHGDNLALLLLDQSSNLAVKLFLGLQETETGNGERGKGGGEMKYSVQTARNRTEPSGWKQDVVLRCLAMVVSQKRERER